MRGKGTLSSPVISCTGITPAYAGKSVPLSFAPPCTKDHPRLCGEKLPSAGNSPVTLGSPPPMRGKVTRTVGNGLQHRITPAYAGKSTVRGILTNPV